MAFHGSESQFELTTIERLRALGYEHIHGSEIDRDHTEIVLTERATQ